MQLRVVLILVTWVPQKRQGKLHLLLRGCSAPPPFKVSWSLALPVEKSMGLRSNFLLYSPVPDGGVGLVQCWLGWGGASWLLEIVFVLRGTWSGSSLLGCLPHLVLCAPLHSFKWTPMLQRCKNILKSGKGQTLCNETWSQYPLFKSKTYSICFLNKLLKGRWNVFLPT